MIDLTNAMNKTVPISMFNRGLASKVFKNVKQQGALVVMKNNVAECVLVSPKEYVSLMDELNDMKLQLLAMQRMANADLSSAVPADRNDWIGLTQKGQGCFDPSSGSCCRLSPHHR